MADIRVLHVASHLDIRMGGSIVAAFGLASAATGDGFHCTVAGTVRPGSETDAHFRKQHPELEIKAFPMNFPQHSFNSHALRDWLAANVASFDLVHIHGLFNFPYLHGGRFAIRARRPLIISPHNSLDPYDLRKKALLKRWFYGPLFVRRLLSGAACALCASQLEADRLEMFGANPEPPREVVPLPVEECSGAAQASWREAHGIPRDDVVVLFLSRMDPKKGLDLLIPAFARARKAGGGATLVIAGKGDDAYEARMRELARQEGIEPCVRWIGFVSGEERNAAYANCDIFALPSYNENFGIAVVEAMYFGKAILISNEVYIHQVLAKHDCGVVCAPDIASVADAMGRLLENRGAREDMGRRASAAARSEFAPGVVRTRLRDVYRRVAGGATGDPR
jgi:glycosyltransferase involved in cell wall biosynthesis